MRQRTADTQSGWGGRCLDTYGPSAKLGELSAPREHYPRQARSHKRRHARVVAPLVELTKPAYARCRSLIPSTPAPTSPRASVLAHAPELALGLTSPLVKRLTTKQSTLIASRTGRATLHMHMRSPKVLLCVKTVMASANKPEILDRRFSAERKRSHMMHFEHPPLAATMPIRALERALPAITSKHRTKHRTGYGAAPWSATKLARTHRLGLGA